METEQTQIPVASRGRRIRAYVALAVVFTAVFTGGWFWYKDYTKFFTTDDAYLDADKVAVSARMMGRITKIYAAEGDSVKTGKLLFELDSTDLVAQKIQAIAAKDQAVSNLHQTEARYELDKKTSVVQEINTEKAKDDLTRATAQLQGNVISQEQFDHVKKAYESAVAQLDASKATLEVSKAQIDNAASIIKTANAQIGTISSLLNNTKIFAPGSGRIAKKWLSPGDVVQPGQAAFTITKDSLIWVAALFEETKIGGIYPGQKAEFTIDAFPGLVYYGKVYYIGSNTAAQFSLIPPNNASGNFTKITQRIPVKISIDSCTDLKHNYSGVKLAAGMSVYVKIYKK
jgi:membrane fusion protein, multidrug efflux system